MSARRFGLIAHNGKPGARELTHDLCREFTRQGREVLLEARTARLAGSESTHSSRDLARNCDLVVVLGGDGTILQVLHEFGDELCPIFGINIGSLGFLTSAASNEWERAVECLIAGTYKLSERTLLQVEVWQGQERTSSQIALNDAVISRGELSRLIKIDVRIDGMTLSEYNADGLIVATSTGSTAYSLSAGGPVLTPNSGVFVVTPICPHVLTMRPVIVSNDSIIEIAPVAGQQDVFLTLDGQQAVPITTEHCIRISKAPHRVPLAGLPDMSFFGVLREKLKWSGSAV
ncbi:MAG TPA: NAD(+)/NADH kinase [Chthoniobacteraceae bacterium]|nr:NAD(+)/NADH kinase [Chthoniobacteraceae bacterium]